MKMRELFEYKASPNTLSRIASHIDATVGMEFEMVVPNKTLINITKSFSEYIGKEVYSSSTYHGGPRKENAYTIEPDSSIIPTKEYSSGLEFISPPMPFIEMIEDLKKTIAWAKKNGCSTNESTGLHMNISINGKSMESLNYIKLILLLGDQYVLEKFERSINAACESSYKKISKIMNIISTDKDRREALLNHVRADFDHAMNTWGKGMFSSKSIDKYQSVHLRDNYVEFGGPGGDWLKMENKSIITLSRFIVCLDAACDPQKYRREFMKKWGGFVEKSLPTTSLGNIVASYLSGNITKEEAVYKLKGTESPSLGIYGVRFNNGNNMATYYDYTDSVFGMGRIWMALSVAKDMYKQYKDQYPDAELVKKNSDGTISSVKVDNNV